MYYTGAGVPRVRMSALFILILVPMYYTGAGVPGACTSAVRPVQGPHWTGGVSLVSGVAVVQSGSSSDRL